MKTPRGTAAAVLALACAATGAAAQAGPQPLRIGAEATGTLAASDPTANGRGAFRVYQFTGRRGQRLAITMKAKDFDAYLSVGRTVMGITDVVKTDDDGGGGTDARVRFTVPQDGNWLVIAQSLPAEGAGSYTLLLDTLPAPVIRPPVALQMGRTVNATLTETDPTLESDDSHYHMYTLNARRGQRLEITMRSSDMDPYLAWGTMKNGEFESSSTDDDGGGGTDSRLRVTVPDDGVYYIRANTALAAQTGAYTLMVTERPPAPPPPAPTPIRAGAQVSGTLSATDPQTDDDSYYDLYRYTGHRGERVTITMRSDAFDTFVALGKLDGGRFNELITEDDGADGTNTRLEFTLDSDGEYVIRATSLGGSQTGAYTLLVETAAAAAAKSTVK
ncbi:MAG TPA: hypothetical protein VFH27_00380 [Longimicrobiaceae bacterium]|nr:hypothetical protein [Longimicrobiaceae bacterium]